MIPGTSSLFRLGIVPLALFFVVFFAYPVLHFLWGSLVVGAGGASSLSLHNFTDALHSPSVLRSLSATLLLSVLTGVVSLVLGYLLAFQVVRRNAVIGRIIFVAAIASLFTSTIARALGWRVLLGFEGPINNALVAIGLISQPLQLINNFTAVAIGMIHIQVPVVMVGLIPVIEALPRDFERAAIGLGAPRWKTFLTVHLPMTWMNAVPVGLIAIMATAAYFTTPVLLGGGRVDVIAIQIQQASQVLFDFGYAATLSVMLVAMISAVAVVVLLLTHWRRNVRARGSSS
ncbi:ABC transporter permease [Starkeya sp. 3C]|uniref:ABC transporter permease n=1 Tax=Ancylobacter moscoviensis TaxID=2597768 RepID=A0ABY3DLM5_9HYPH|nr:ABC transporter permease [Ancylobacter moscoviensis]TSJ60142.1 ABC transporter permease [Ancylobacter moscoviensis]